LRSFGRRRPPPTPRQVEQSATNLPHREKYLQLVLGFLRNFVDLQQQLIDDVERELGTPRRKTRAG
jgi:hypothetical protein